MVSTDQEPYLLKEEKIPESFFEKAQRWNMRRKAQATNGSLAEGRAREILDELDEAVLHSTSGQERKARKVIRQNTLAFKDQIAPIASKFHKIVFHRDLWSVCQYVDSPLFIEEALNMMVRAQDEEGKVQTAQSAFGRGGLNFQDETTFYLPILAYQAEVEHHITLSQGIQEGARKAGEYTARQVNEEGFIVNKSHRRSDWLDELLLPEGDVVASKQGLGILALRKAYQRGDIKDKYVVERAEDGYRELPRRWDNRMPHSLLTGWRGVSALGPEGYSILWDNVKMLDDIVMENTIRSFITRSPREWEVPDLGLRVITDQDGRYLDEDHFIHPNLGGQFMNHRGFYHNGATWPKEDMKVVAAARGHHMDLGFLPAHMKGVLDPETLIHLIFASGSHLEEFWPTGRHSNVIEEYDRVDQTWLVEMLDLQRRMERRFSQVA